MPRHPPSWQRVYPTSGGTYVYGRERLGDWWGFMAGWGFVVGKTASCAAMALTFASYAVPGPWWAQRLVAVAGVLALAALNYRGVTRTAQLTRVLVAASLTALAVVVAGIAAGGHAGPAHLGGWSALGTGGWYGILQSAGLLFFAFAGYARIATMGEEVRDPQRTIPRAIPVALLLAVVVYLVVGSSRAAGRGPGPVRHGHRTAGHRRAGRRCRCADARGADRGRAGVAGCAAGADRRHRPHRTGHGPPPRPARAGWPPCTRATRCRTTRRSRWRWW